MTKIWVVCLVILLFYCQGNALASPSAPCNKIGYASGNTYIQSPGFTENLSFVNAVALGTCVPTTATIIVTNPPQNPPPNAPVYISLYYYTAGPPVVGPNYTSQVLLVQGTTVINSDDVGDWFVNPTGLPSFTGVSIVSPSTPWVPASITVIWQ